MLWRDRSNCYSFPKNKKQLLTSSSFSHGSDWKYPVVQNSVFNMPEYWAPNQFLLGSHGLSDQDRNFINLKNSSHFIFYSPLSCSESHWTQVTTVAGFSWRKDVLHVGCLHLCFCIWYWCFYNQGEIVQIKALQSRQQFSWSAIFMSHCNLQILPIKRPIS